MYATVFVVVVEQLERPHLDPFAADVDQRARRELRSEPALQADREIGGLAGMPGGRNPDLGPLTGAILQDEGAIAAGLLLLHERIATAEEAPVERVEIGRARR